MRGLWDRVRLRRTVLFVLITALVASGVALATRGGDGGHLAANRDQLRKACDGTLPYGDLERLVRDGRPGELSQHGTMLAPGRQSRSLLDCSLNWGAGYGVTVHAEALVSDVPEAVKTRELLDTGGGAFVAPGTTGQYGKRGAWLVADCLYGLSGRVRPTTDLYVTARVTAGADQGKGETDRTAALTGFRTAVHVANAITKAQHCGSAPLVLPTDVVNTDETHGAPGRDLRTCGWISGSSLPGVRSGTWTTVGDLQESTRLSACAGAWDADAERNEGERPKQWQITGVEAASWSGILGRSAYDAYEREGHVPGWGADEESRRPSEAGPEADAKTDAKTDSDSESDSESDSPSGSGTGSGADRREDRISSDVSHPQLALWARSVCGGRATYHRVSVLPEVRLADGETAVLGAEDRAKLSRTARTVLDRYLSAKDGWPKSADCRDTKVLGEVEQWH
ncbi:hypothetical protein ABZS86_05665 [Streptomyces sp. NPDC005355]|uniref:hypothetical protein n=1 Tax=Streptomyces sp. NPDC005355 TaxID=3157038 RepID=UPI0033AD5634